VTVEVSAGTVTAISADEIKIDVNGDDEGKKTFSIPDGVEVPEDMAVGDRAAVVVKDGEVSQIFPGKFPVPIPGILPGLDGGFNLPFGGAAKTVEVVSGAVSNVSADEITLDLGGDQGEKTFSIPDDVDVPEGLETGEHATVVVHDGEVAKIAEGGLPFEGELPFPHRFRGPGFPFEEPLPEPGEATPEA
jgi:hypothetical protein